MHRDEECKETLNEKFACFTDNIIKYLTGVTRMNRIRNWTTNENPFEISTIEWALIWFGRILLSCRKKGCVQGGREGGGCALWGFTVAPVSD